MYVNKIRLEVFWSLFSVRPMARINQIQITFCSKLAFHQSLTPCVTNHNGRCGPTLLHSGYLTAILWSETDVVRM